jgi:hypothetical protein
MCTKYKTHRLLQNILGSINTNIKDHQIFRNGEQIAWSTFGGEIPESEGGISIFTSGIGNRRGIDGAMVKKFLHRLCWANCETCGSVELTTHKGLNIPYIRGYLRADYMKLEDFGKNVSTLSHFDIEREFSNIDKGKEAAL